jgi:hypothetical protein
MAPPLGHGHPALLRPSGACVTADGSFLARSPSPAWRSAHPSLRWGRAAHRRLRVASARCGRPADGPLASSLPCHRRPTNILFPPGVKSAGVLPAVSATLVALTGARSCAGRRPRGFAGQASRFSFGNIFSPGDWMPAAGVVSAAASVRGMPHPLAAEIRTISEASPGVVTARLRLAGYARRGTWESRENGLASVASTIGSGTPSGTPAHLLSTATGWRQHAGLDLEITSVPLSPPMN